MAPRSLLSTASVDGRALLAAAECGWELPAPHCPEWAAAGLVRHTGGIFEWMAAVVVARERVSRRTLDPAPEDPAALSPWYLAALDRAVDVLGSVEPDSQTWTFSPTSDRRVGWWWRRLAVEVSIHRYDAEHAASLAGRHLPAPIDGAVAAAGVEEFVVEFLPGLLDSDGVEGLAGTLHLHATDGPLEWSVDLDAAGTARSKHAEADTAVGATRSDLLLWLTNRAPLGPIKIVGNRVIAEQWRQLRR